VINRAYRLRRRPVGEPVGDDLQLVSEELPPLSDGELGAIEGLYDRRIRAQVQHRW